MVRIISGKKGKGKTKYLLDRANAAVKESTGSIVYLDKSSKHMYELNTQVRLINVTDYDVDSRDAFLGFISGIVAQDHDLQEMFLDSFLKLAHLEGQDCTETINYLQNISEKYGVNFTISVSADEDELPYDVQKLIDISL